MLRSPTRSTYRSASPTTTPTTTAGGDAYSMHSAPSSPINNRRSPTKRRTLDFAGVAKLFIYLRRLDKAAKTNNGGGANAKTTVLSSGSPMTHAGIEDGAVNQERLPIEFTDHFVCSGGVNVATLLRASRSELMERVGELGANALLNEEWECVIHNPKTPHNGVYKVDIRYGANATVSTARDPRRPVALDQARSIPGLMTIIKRYD